MKKFKWVEHPIPLLFKRNELLGHDLEKNCKAPRPIISINNEYLVLSNSFVIIRNLFLIPALLSALYLCSTEVQEIYKGWKSSEVRTVDFIELRKKNTEAIILIHCQKVLNIEIEYCINTIDLMKEAN